MEGTNHFVYDPDLSKATDVNAFVGRWDFRVKPRAERPENAPANAAIGFSASTLSNLRLDLGVAAPGEEPGNEIIVDVEVTESGNAPANQNAVQSLVATVTLPSGKQFSLKPEYAGNGRFRTRFDDTFKPGTYKVSIQSKLKNRKGELASREATSFVLIGKKLLPTHEPCPERKINPWWWFVLVIAFILLIIAAFRPFPKPTPK